MRFNPPPNWPRLPDTFVPPPGWQPDPDWGGVPYGWPLWIEDAQPPAQPKSEPPALTPLAAFQSAPASSAESPRAGKGWAIAAVVVLMVIGLIVGYQPVSLLSGDGILYVGLAMTAGAVIVAFATRLGGWTKILAVVAVVAVGANIGVVEHEMAQRRQEIRNDLNNLGTTLQQLSAPPTALPCSTNPGFGCDPNS